MRSGPAMDIRNRPPVPSKSPPGRPAGAIPRRQSAARSRSRARAIRLLTVPTGHLRCRAASSYDRPSRSQRTTTMRCRSGRRSISRCRTSARSSGIRPSVHTALSSAARLSAALRRIVWRRAWMAMRRATRWSQGAIESHTQSEPAFWTSTRNVAWKASADSCSLCSTARQVRQTNGPCRSTSAAKADSDASPSRRANCSINCPSVSPVSEPALNSDCKPRGTAHVRFDGTMEGPL